MHPRILKGALVPCGLYQERRYAPVLRKKVIKQPRRAPARPVVPSGVKKTPGAHPARAAQATHVGSRHDPGRPRLSFAIRGSFLPDRSGSELRTARAQENRIGLLYYLLTLAMHSLMQRRSPSGISSVVCPLPASSSDTW